MWGEKFAGHRWCMLVYNSFRRVDAVFCRSAESCDSCAILMLGPCTNDTSKHEFQDVSIQG